MNKPILADQDIEYINVKINDKKTTRAILIVCAFGISLIAISLLNILVIFVSNYHDNKYEISLPIPVKEIPALAIITGIKLNFTFKLLIKMVKKSHKL